MQVIKYTNVKHWSYTGTDSISRWTKSRYTHNRLAWVSVGRI